MARLVNNIKLPSSGRGRKAGEDYAALLQEFTEGKQPHSLLDGLTVSVSSAVVGLSKARKALRLEDAVEVSKRTNPETGKPAVYLIRKVK